MTLKHKMLRGLISLGVIAFTSTFFIFEMMNSYRSMNAYMHYIIEKAESTLLYDKYQNQSIASFLTRSFSAPKPPVSEQKNICTNVENHGSSNGIYPPQQLHSLLMGTLITLDSDCSGWTQDIPQLAVFDKAIESVDIQNRNDKKPTFDVDLFTYYVDLKYKYIYTTSDIDLAIFNLSNQDFQKYDKIKMNATVLSGFESIKKTTSEIQHDTFNNKNIMSIMSPVYVAGELKGIVVTEYTLSNLKDIFYPYDRPLVSRNLDITILDTQTNDEIIVLRSKKSIFNYVNYSHNVESRLQILLSLDVLYFILSLWKIILFYVFSTAVLLHLVRMHFRHYHDVSRENISDTMTGLYNRKILTGVLESRLQRILAVNSAVTFIALDCDKLKMLNDTWGHKEGDRAIITLANAIKDAVRVSDYPVRLGGDEFLIILLDFSLAESQKLIERIEDHIRKHDDTGRIHFSWGAVAMKPGDTLDDMYKAADAALYINKAGKHC
ncbi:diguanylate cyclase DgcJ [Buttiauxella agrestis]|uniref:diguanylate cyclase DgcJ n=1 Tax=Buttiauxella agrestis TaxID=82977 RepID=UPI0039759809